MPSQPHLNVFQRLVRKWEGIHPYNGAQLARFHGPLPPNAHAQWHAAAASLGLSDLAAPARDESRPLTEFLTAELNHTYADAEPPLRAICVPGPDHHWLGVAYRHWVADSVAVRTVLREWAALLHAPALARGAEMRRSAGGYWRLFGPGDAGGGDSWSLLRGLLLGAQQTSRMKRVQRIEPPPGSGYGTAFSLHDLPDGTIPRVHAWAKRRNQKVNDVLLAALAEAMALHGGLQRTPRRQDLAFGSIVDLRPYADQDLSDVFSLYLGFTTVFLRPSHFDDFELLSRQISRQHALGREARAASTSLLRMTAGLVTHRLVTEDRKIGEFYRKRIPLAAGISNVNLSSDPLANLHPRLLQRYVRVSPTGPMMPLVISATTVNNAFNFGLTRRASVISDQQAADIAATITARLTHL
jgi:hypothetical protein